MCYLQQFNRKRAGEIERLLINDLRNYKTTDKENNSVLYNSLSSSERAFAEKYVKVEIRGKLGRTVPVIIQRNLLVTLNMFLSYRTDAGVAEDNPYVFGLPGHLNYLRACVVLKQFAEECGASNPTTLRGTALRKHLATSVQVLDLGENELGRLANFMGHDVRIYKDHYRLPSTAVELSQTSKILTLMEGTNVENYRGLTLLDITTNDQSSFTSTNQTSFPSTIPISKPSATSASVQPLLRPTRRTLHPRHQPTTEDNICTPKQRFFESDDYHSEYVPPSSSDEDDDFLPRPVTSAKPRIGKFQYILHSHLVIYYCHSVSVATFPHVCAAYNRFSRYADTHF